ncbi:hypothetical protein MC885_002879 [Smutsia gigantea]|nr:hypothetical protein MC885_002879 [Smutsia gigantea]
MAKEEEDEKKAKKGKKGKKAPEPEKPKRSLKGTSRLFMGFRDRTPKISKKGQFRSASAFFWGLHTGPQKTKRKKKARTVLKSTSKLMTQMRMGKKKRAMKGKKPSFMVIRFPGRRGYGRLRPRAQSLSKASTAINWLTKKFLIKKAEAAGSEQATLDAWLNGSGSRMGSRKLPFPSGAEILRHGGRLRRFPRSRSIYASGEPVGFLPFEDEAPFRPSGSRKSLYGLEGFQDLGEYYDYYRDGDDYYDQESLYQYEEEEPYSPYGPYGPYGHYGLAWPPYGDQAHGYPPEDPHDHCHPDYYSGSYYPAYGYGYNDYEPPYAPPYGYMSPYSSYYECEGGAHPHSHYPDPYAPYDATYRPYDLSYDLPYDMPYADPYGVPYDAPYGVPYAEGLYGGGDQTIYPPEVPYLYPDESFAYPWVPPSILSPHNPYAPPMDDIAELEELEEPEEEGAELPRASFRLPSAAFFEQQGMDKPASSKLSLIRRFRLFPRPQVKLFGKEKLEVPLPPSLDIPLPLGAADEDEEEEEMPAVPCTHPFWGFRAPRQRNLQRALSAFGAHRGLGFSPELSCPAPRPATSLARFLKKTLSDKKPASPLRGSPKARLGAPAVKEAAYKRFGYKLAGMDPDRPSTPIVLRRAQARGRSDRPRPPAPRPAPPCGALIPPPGPSPPPAPPFSPVLSGLRRPASPYGSLRQRPPPWAAPTRAPLPPQASRWAFAEPPPVGPEGPPDLLAFPGPRPSFKGSRRRAAAFGLPGLSPHASRRRAWVPQPSLRSLPGLAYRPPAGSLSPQPATCACRFQPPFSPPRSRARSLREPPSPHCVPGLLGPPRSPTRGSLRPPSPPPLPGHSSWRRSLNLPAGLPHTWRRLSEPPTRAVKPRVRQPHRRPPGSGSWPVAAAVPGHRESQRGPEDSETPWTVPALSPSWDVDTPPTRHPPSPWPGGAGSRRGFSRPPPVPENPFLQHVGPVSSLAPRPEGPASHSTSVFLGGHHDLGPGQLATSASPSPEKLEEETTPGNPKPPTPEPLKDSPPEQKALKLSLSGPLASCNWMRATWPPRRRWGMLLSAPAPLAPTGALGPLPKVGERRQAMVMPRVQKLSSLQRVGPATLQPSIQLTQDPEPSPKPRAWSLLWSHLLLPVEAHQCCPGVLALPPACCLGPGATCLPHRGPWEEVGSESWRSKMHSIRNLPSMRFREQHREDGVDDMTQLEFDQNLIYTYIGSILVSVNPYQMFGIYGPEQVQQYSGRALGENPPHLFAIANLAFAKMLDAKQNQCIIISGESGSGKTEATKLILRYLAAMNQKRGIMQQVSLSVCCMV